MCPKNVNHHLNSTSIYRCFWIHVYLGTKKMNSSNLLKSRWGFRFSIDHNTSLKAPAFPAYALQPPFHSTKAKCFRGWSKELCGWIHTADPGHPHRWRRRGDHYCHCRHLCCCLPRYEERCQKGQPAHGVWEGIPGTKVLMPLAINQTSAICGLKNLTKWIMKAWGQKTQLGICEWQSQLSFKQLHGLVSLGWVELGRVFILVRELGTILRAGDWFTLCMELI